jgi:hypothetical protein
MFLAFSRVAVASGKGYARHAEVRRMGIAMDRYGQVGRISLGSKGRDAGCIELGHRDGSN